MKKLMITLNFISLIAVFGMISSVNMPSPVGFVALSSIGFSFQPMHVLAFFLILITLVLNVYFLLRK